MDKKQINCPHYTGDGYGYSLAEVEFNFCSYCNRRLFHRMVSQYKLEKKHYGDEAFQDVKTKIDVVEKEGVENV